MQYLLTLYAEEAGFQRMTKEQQQQGMPRTWPTPRHSNKQEPT